MAKNRCLRCRYEWIALVENPKICPRCKSYYWNKVRIRKKKESMWDRKKTVKEGGVKYVKGKDPKTVMEGMKF